jgi:Ras-related protein Rab-5C
MNQYDRGTYKISLLGDSFVGKTTLVSSYMDRDIHSGVVTTGSAFDQKNIKINNKEISYQIWDTAGQERYNAIIPLYSKNSSVLIVAYAINDENSFNNLNKWIKLGKTDAVNALVYIVGTKSDLNVDRKISYETLKNFAMSNKYYHIEVSSYTKTNIDELFNNIGKLLTSDNNFL